MAYHLTGLYPDWWEGRRWDRPVRAWMGGKDNISVRDAAVVLLLGGPGERGTGLIPGDLIEDISSARGAADTVDNVTVRHASKLGLSRLTFKTYDQGRERWQGATLDLIWFDEEPNENIYSEGLTRTNATGGMSFMTFTPLLGESNVVMKFLKEPISPDRHDTVMTLDDAPHITEAERRIILDRYPEHEIEARTMGTPILGSGRVFTVPESEIAVSPDDFKPPSHWPQLGAMDLGWEHPFAAVHLYYDTEGDVIYIAKAYRAKHQTPIQHAGAVKGWGKWIPWAWPHDALNETSAGGGKALKAQYEDHGLNMIGIRAQFPDGSISVEAGIMEMIDRMTTGRLKVVKSLADWFEEYRSYHRKDGVIVKERDDLMSATRYGVMMIRKALLPPALRSENRNKNRNPLGGDPLAEF